MCANAINPYFLGVRKTIIIYSLAIAGAAFLLQWMEFLHVVRAFSTEIYMVLRDCPMNAGPFLLIVLLRSPKGCTGMIFLSRGQIRPFQGAIKVFRGEYSSSVNEE